MKTAILPILVLTAAPFVSVLAGPVHPAAPPISPAGDWLDDTIPPVTNPIFFEDPAIRSEVRPIFIHHRIDGSFATGGGDVNLYALQFRYAINDRLALIATKDGYIDIDLDNGANPDGWADVALGFKYAVIDDRANEFILTPGFTFELPIGNSEVFQGNGDGELNLFVSAAKGFGNFHLTGNTGVRIPFDGDEESAILHYSLMADVKISRWFQPFVAMSGITVLDEGNGLPLTTEGYDLINFGSSLADGETQITVGGGFRSRLTDSLMLGVAYEAPVTSPHGLYDDRFTVDLIWNF
jgi:hypothetical protein